MIRAAFVIACAITLMVAAWPLRGWAGGLAPSGGPLSPGDQFVYAARDSVVQVVPTTSATAYVQTERLSVTSAKLGKSVGLLQFVGEFLDDALAPWLIVGFPLQSGVTTEAEYGWRLNQYYATSTLTYASPRVLDELPESQGAAWNGSEAFVQRADGDDPYFTYQYGLQVATDGSYAEKRIDAYFGSRSSSLLNSDGSGWSRDSSPKIRRRFGLPYKSSEGWVIPVTFNQIHVKVPDWFPPRHKLPPRPLRSDRFAISANVRTPAPCGAMRGKAAADVHETFRFLDPVEGVVTAGEDHAYDVPGVGTICELYHHVVERYANSATGKLENETVYAGSRILTSETLKRQSTESFRSSFVGLGTFERALNNLPS